MARTIALKLHYAPRSDLILPPHYRIEDPPWLQTRSYSDGAAPAESRASSIYSTQPDDDDDEYSDSFAAAMHDDAPDPSFARPQQLTTDSTPPQTRTTRVPIFKQVRSMLSNNRGMPTNTSPTSAIKWDEYSGEISENGKEPQIKPSTWKSPYEGILKPRRPSASRSNREPGQRSVSPVSTLVYEELQLLEQEPGNMSPPNSRPISPVSAAVEHIAPLHISTPEGSIAPVPVPATAAAAAAAAQHMPPLHMEKPMPRPQTAGDVTSRVKRKPVASSKPEQHHADTIDVRVVPTSSDGERQQEDDDPSSRFSWTTAAPSEAPRHSTDTRFARQTRVVSEHDSQPYNSSHFSWSTVASAVPGAMREQTPPPSPPPVPAQYLEQQTYTPSQSPLPTQHQQIHTSTPSKPSMPGQYLDQQTYTPAITQPEQPSMRAQHLEQQAYAPAPTQPSQPYMPEQYLEQQTYTPASTQPSQPSMRGQYLEQQTHTPPPTQPSQPSIAAQHLEQQTYTQTHSQSSMPAQYLEPQTYTPPPTQSIVSRQRPYKRVDKSEWAPPPAPVSEGYTPRSLTPKVHRVEEHPTRTADGQKRLPLPPLFTEKSLSHLEALLTQEKNIELQRRNIERSITELERVESASPLEVSFSVVREARKKLEERRKVLDEVRMEEMDVGIRIARARRKEDFADGEGTFWVRRVTG